MNWRDRILNEFTPQVARLTIVADPDELLLEEDIARRIRERGFDLLPFEDHMSFRYAYESQYRSTWGKKETPDLIVTVRASAAKLNSLPYDVLQAGRKLSFSLSDLFPTLSYPVISHLDRSDLDELFEAAQNHPNGVLGDNATKDFVLRHVYKLAPDSIRQPVDLLKALLHRHYQGVRFPTIFDKRLIQFLRQERQFEEWPLEVIIPDRESFFRFLQERWPHFIVDWYRKTYGDELAIACPEISSPTLLPFDHPAICVYLDNLFLEGILRPIETVQRSDQPLPGWIAAGIYRNPAAERIRRVEGLLDALQETVPDDTARHRAWVSYARRWAEFIYLWHQMNEKEKSPQAHKFEQLRDRVDETFLTWLETRYASLHTLPPATPAMLHQLPRYLARVKEEEPQRKWALVVMDGLALDQWLVMRDVLSTQLENHIFHEEAVFAWLPTVTSVSRQAIFAGKTPNFFPNSIHTTAKELTLWTQFWMDQGLSKSEIGYLKGLGDAASLSSLDTLLDRSNLQVLGLVVDKVDRIMHGMELGTQGMHNQVRQWTEQGVVAAILQKLSEKGFHVLLTADHGNVECYGIGNPKEGVLAETRGERVRIYPDQRLRARIKGDFPESIEWKTIGLPGDYLPLLAQKRTAFVPIGDSLVGHGGATLEEVIVPLIKIDPILA